MASESMNCNAPDTGNMEVLERVGTEAQKKQWLEPLLNGEIRSAYVMTEPHMASSDAKNVSMKCELDGDEYVLNGEKTSISAADQADAAVVFGRTGSAESGAHGVTALLVPMDLPGITRNRFDCHGQRAIGRGSIFFENVRVPIDHRLGAENKGFVQVMQGFDFSRALIGLQVLAVARVALEETWAYVAQREAFGKPLSAFQGVSHPLADFETQVEAARLLCLQTLWLKDKGAPHTSEAAMCKLQASEVAERTASLAINLFGGYGFVKDAPVEKLYRDAKIGQIYEGTSNLQLQTIAKALLA
jgi:cyclohexanecarboxyl-CoA dehydrogenase